MVKLFDLKADSRPTDDVADVLVGIFDLTDTLAASTPRKIQIVGTPASGVVAQDIFGLSFRTVPGALNTTVVAMFGYQAVPSPIPFQRLDIVRLSFLGNAVLPASTILDVLESQDDTFPTVRPVNLITGVADGAAAFDTLLSSPLDPTLLPGPYGTVVVRRTQFPVGALAANTPFTTPGDVVASLIPPTVAGGTGARRILLAIHGNATGPALGLTEITFSATVRIVR